MNPEYLDELDNIGIIKYCPNKAYDDRFIVEASLHHNGVIISNDQYRDIIKEKPEYKDKLRFKIIFLNFLKYIFYISFKNNKNRLLEYVFSDDLFMLASDPFGRRGPKLDEYLAFNAKAQQQQQNLNNKQQQHRFNVQNNNQIVDALDLTYLISSANNNNTRSNTRNQTPVGRGNITNLHDLKEGKHFESYLKAAQANNNNNNNKRTTPDVKIYRNVEQTTKLEKELKNVFPNNEAEIKEILNKYPTQYSLEYLSNKLLERLT